jgi:DNA-directed RNA polymerase subunit RPC12/RpoP
MNCLDCLNCRCTRCTKHYNDPAADLPFRFYVERCGEKVLIKERVLARGEESVGGGRGGGEWGGWVGLGGEGLRMKPRSTTEHP